MRHRFPDLGYKVLAKSKLCSLVMKFVTDELSKMQKSQAKELSINISDRVNT